jgi:hypothetical protein
MSEQPNDFNDPAYHAEIIVAQSTQSKKWWARVTVGTQINAAGPESSAASVLTVAGLIAAEMGARTSSIIQKEWEDL